ncbi:type III pantothenate kinase [Thiomicrorhabdus sp.]|uniref:type III pantothenate kinase n=1 Tax=Thiomicrorhabdus sp. TaxID=2039724 RepID=UPI002AA7F913|nr:type III pantothenate kinase [Thiomicrorhabdus sp.]
MLKLFLDVGNSFVKWATVLDNTYEVHEAVSFEQIETEGLSCFDVVKSPDVVYFSSVGDAHRVDELKLAIQEHWQVFPIQLTAQKQCCGLTSGYTDFNQLGDDRWFAMQGALGIYSDPVIVVDAGTALTIDAIQDGQHLGGFIVPGLYTMRVSLAKNTQNLSLFNDVETVDSERKDNLLATNTAEGILGGTLYMTVSFINQVVFDLNNQLKTQFKLIITGGDARKICSLIDYEFDYVPDLVLQGMVNIEESIKKE